MCAQVEGNVDVRRRRLQLRFDISTRAGFRVYDGGVRHPPEILRGFPILVLVTRHGDARGHELVDCEPKVLLSVS